jgi:hypothetical protein
MKDQHDLAPHHLPNYIPGPDGSDPLFTFIVILVLILGLVLGALYFKLHALPERMAHGQNSTQLQLIAVLAILALLTHNNVFWVGALLLAVVRFPNFITPINSIDQSLKTLAERQARDEGETNTEKPDDPPRPESSPPTQPSAGAPEQEN